MFEKSKDQLFYSNKYCYSVVKRHTYLLGVSAAYT